jgi:peptidoglycan lytic transglycosylase G
MSRDGYERWRDRRDAGPDGYDTQGGGRRARRAARADEQWLPDSQTPDSQPGRGSHRRSGQYPEDGYTDPGYTDPGYRDRDYRDGGSQSTGYEGYPDAGYADGRHADGRYSDAGYSSPGYADAGYPGQSDSYGQPADYGRGAGYPDGGYPDGGYPAVGYGSSGDHSAPGYGGTGMQNGSPDATYPPDDYRAARDPYGATDPYRAAPDGYDPTAFGGGGRSSGEYGEQVPYGGPGGHDTGDPYAGRDSRARRAVDRAGYDGPAGAQYGAGYDDQGFGAAAGPDPREQYLERGADYGRGADGGAAYGWRDPVDDTGVTRRRQRDPEDDFDPDSARHNGFFRGFGAADDEVGHRPPRRKRSRAGMAALLILIILIGGLVGGGAYAYKWYTKRHADWTGSTGSGSVVVRVLPGEFACSSSLENLLVSDGVVASAAAFCNAAKANGGGAQLEPGYFRLHKHMGAALAWALIINPKSRVQTKVAVPDGLRASKIIALMAQKTGIPLSQFESALKDTSALGLPSWAHGNPEGFLWPATYPFEPGTSAQAMLQTLVKHANSEYASMNLAAKAKAAHFTEYQVIIEASLLEGEVPPQYYTKVAKVIDNRLNQGMYLGLDSTVAYALNKYIYNLTASDLSVNSPFNTFKHLDLPPAPIDSPDAAAIAAVLHPAQISDLYFVTVNKQGLTEFTSDPNQFQIWSNEAKRNGV